MRAHHKSAPLACPLALLCFLWVVGLSSSFGTPTNIFSTQFEVAKGYNPNLNLSGQNGWTNFGSGGNGLTDGFFNGQGQQAFVGYFPPAPGSSNLFVWHPINFSPIAAGLPLVTFTTLMSVVGPTNGNYDFFQWHVFNNQTQPLFIIDFDTDTTNVGYFLDGTQYVNSGVQFALGSTYTLTVTMNFAANQWSAKLNSSLLAANQPITSTGKELTLGDIDAVWNLYLANAPGDNFMLFDNYTITAEALPPPPPVLYFAKLAATNALCYWSTNYSDYHLEYNQNLATHNWAASGRTPVVTGTNFVVTNSMFLGKRFYRLSRVPAAYTPPPPVLSIAPVPPGSVRLSWPADDELTFKLQSSTNLSTTNWTPVPSVQGVQGASYVVTDTPTNAAKFYRLATP